MSDSPSAPTRVRYLVVFATFLTAVLLYLDRFCISYAQRYIKEDLGLNDDQLGWCFSAFFIAYALAQVPSGWLSDRFGARGILTVYVLAWSAFTASMGLAAGFVMLLVLRAAVGISQAGAYPTSAGLLGRWVPFSSRGRANSFVAFGGRLGGFAAPVLTVYLVIAFVPVESSSEFQRGDILDARRLSFELSTLVEWADRFVQPDEHEDAVRQVRDTVSVSLSPTSRQLIQQLGFEFQPTEHDAARDVDNAVAEALADVSEAGVETLRMEINRLLDDDTLHRNVDLEALAVEREAKSLAAKAVRSTLETQRLNRLVLEATFPESLRKVYGRGWRHVMFIYGALGLFVASVFWLSFRERPAEHPWCNREEQALIEAGRPAVTRHTGSQAGGIPVRDIVSSRSLWLMCINQFGGNVGWVFLMTWLPRYLLEVHSTPLIERGWMAATPLCVGWMGMLLGGWLTDRVTGRFGLRWRTAPIVLGRFAAAAAYLSCLVAPNAWAATAAFALIAFSNDLCNPASWSYKQDVGGPFVAAIHGWANMWGNFGAAVSPVLLQTVIREYGWNAAFLMGAAAFLVAGTAALGVDARIPVVRTKRSVDSPAG